MIHPDSAVELLHEVFVKGHSEVVILELMLHVSKKS